ncbi:MAG TPA: class IV adenylate cyclase [Gemmataceae bacterium]|nr:class IV adenylate cyclase [Gemmataceae bacterium]
MLEIEIKFRVHDFAPLEAKLREWKTEQREERDDIDEYFRAPHRDFAKTDEAFRLRRIGEKNFITYKGPRTDVATKTRLEIEVPLGDGVEPATDLERLVHALGFQPVAVVHKLRRVFKLKRQEFDVEVCLDIVESVGHYAELEIVAPEEQLEKARSLLLQMAKELDLTEMERRSYLELLLEKKSKSSP